VNILEQKIISLSHPTSAREIVEYYQLKKKQILCVTFRVRYSIIC
jgi:hypothetical protein